MGKKVLIADDTLPLRVMIEEVLTEAGYEVIIASDGLEVWKIICSRFKEIDLLVLDLLMPKMSGFEVLAELKKEFPERKFPVLVLSGVFKSEKEISRLKDLGANGYLNKNSVVDDILYRVNFIFYSQLERSRRYPRVLCSLPVDYQFNGNKHSSHTTTLSLGGCFVRTLKPAPKNAIANLWIMVPDCGCNESVHTQGRVVWVNGYDTDYKPNSPPGMGLEFQPIAEDQLECIKELVDQKLHEEDIWKNP